MRRYVHTLYAYIHISITQTHIPTLSLFLCLVHTPAHTYTVIDIPTLSSFLYVIHTPAHTYTIMHIPTLHRTSISYTHKHTHALLNTHLYTIYTHIYTHTHPHMNSAGTSLSHVHRGLCRSPHLQLGDRRVPLLHRHGITLDLRLERGNVRSPGICGSLQVAHLPVGLFCG